MKFIPFDSLPPFHPPLNPSPLATFNSFWKIESSLAKAFDTYSLESLTLSGLGSIPKRFYEHFPSDYPLYRFFFHLKASYWGLRMDSEIFGEIKILLISILICQNKLFYKMTNFFQNFGA